MTDDVRNQWMAMDSAAGACIIIIIIISIIIIIQTIDIGLTQSIDQMMMANDGLRGAGT